MACFRGKLTCCLSIPSMLRHAKITIAIIAEQVTTIDYRPGHSICKKNRLLCEKKKYASFPARDKITRRGCYTDGPAGLGQVGDAGLSLARDKKRRFLPEAASDGRSGAPGKCPQPAPELPATVAQTAHRCLQMACSSGRHLLHLAADSERHCASPAQPAQAGRLVLQLCMRRVRVRSTPPTSPWCSRTAECYHYTRYPSPHPFSHTNTCTLVPPYATHHRTHPQLRTRQIIPPRNILSHPTRHIRSAFSSFPFPFYFLLLTTFHDISPSANTPLHPVIHRW